MSKRSERRKEEKEIFGRKGTATRYQMRQKLIAFGDDFYIHNEAGRDVFKVDGKVLRVRNTLKFKDIQGNTLCQIQERKLRVKDVMAIEDAKGKKIAETKKALIAPLRNRLTVKIRSGRFPAGQPGRVAKMGAGARRRTAQYRRGHGGRDLELSTISSKELIPDENR